MGTALIDRGLQGRAPEWNLTRPTDVLAVHRSHVEAGAQLVLTNTFVGASAEEAAAALQLARGSGAEFVAGSLWAGLPDLTRQIAQLAAADAIWLESATSAARALARLGADAAGYNCSPWPTDSAGAGVLKPDAAGLAPEDWARRVVGFASSARFLGGCRGTTAAHLGALQRLRATPR
ncbi:MAG: hypothetical protein E6J86_05360 [Deltaproteobacteria bacterium]|nr:MAG: hypothetical protein E6J86_05360 [Deltaproteobacteria bacterium]